MEGLKQQQGSEGCEWESAVIRWRAGNKNENLRKRKQLSRNLMK